VREIAAATRCVAVYRMWATRIPTTTMETSITEVVTATLDQRAFSESALAPSGRCGNSRSMTANARRRIGHWSILLTGFQGDESVRQKAPYKLIQSIMGADLAAGPVVVSRPRVGFLTIGTSGRQYA